MAVNPVVETMTAVSSKRGGDIIERVIGTHNVTQLRVLHLEDRFEIAGFVGKTLLTGRDWRT